MNHSIVLLAVNESVSTRLKLMPSYRLPRERFNNMYVKYVGIGTMEEAIEPPNFLQYKNTLV